jgi:3-phenylpropionate/trans-cinnamate dioxygenase ferredoxin reductase component
VSVEFELLVIGGGPAGLAAVRSYREAGASGTVAIVSDEHRMPYRRPPLTKELLQGEISEAELPLEDETWLSQRDVRLVCGRAMAVDHARHQVTLSGGRQLDYGSCVLATGSEPTRLPVPGCDDPSVRVVRSLDDVRELTHRLATVSEVIVIGSGFIGCEIAASLRRRGHPVTLISDEPAPNCGRLGPDVGGQLARWLELDGVTLHLGAGVDAIERRNRRLDVAAGDLRVSGQLIVMATGVAARSELLAASGLTLQGGAVPVDAGMRTALPGLLAAGDVCMAHNHAAGRPLRVEHWGDALAQGAIAGLTAAGQPASWDEVPGFWSTIGGRTLKYAAWGDGYDDCRFERRADGGFSAWYGQEGRIVGVIAHEYDDTYERGKALIAEGAAWS